MKFLLRAYREITKRAYPLIESRLRVKYGAGFEERCGIYGREKTGVFGLRPTLWLHAVSVGEVQAAASVASAAAASGWGGAVVVSTMTETGAAAVRDLMAGRYGAHIYAPWDVPDIAERACSALQPSVFAALETELWPNLLLELRSRKVPRLLINARVSDRRMRRARFMGGTLREMYGLFDGILARSGEDARRLSSIGVDPDKIQVTGDTKIDSILERRSAASRLLPDLAAYLSLGDEPVFVAGSTRSGEEKVILSAYAAARNCPETSSARLIIAPRHTERAKAVAETASGFGRTALFSSGPEEMKRADVVVIDTIGTLYSLYGLASSAFIGGSLVPKGGQNILEPASWGVPTLHGPSMEDFAEPTSALDSSGAAFPIANRSEIESLWRAAARGELDVSPMCAKYFRDRSGASASVWECLERYLQR
ncbi:MAG: 3-deoxy-D-manno-octulosonic acid transferase [Synergistaceae bacterium]|jgi:3-deoxy-D-manno-octulosonic-acid transferase|nr:3-deoxy-D-manno-octulosonic acid transferase [Synergistaceae bacterium]